MGLLIDNYIITSFFLGGGGEFNIYFTGRIQFNMLAKVSDINRISISKWRFSAAAAQAYFQKR